VSSRQPIPKKREMEESRIRPVGFQKPSRADCPKKKHGVADGGKRKEERDEQMEARSLQPQLNGMAVVAVAIA
jgi:hypothetical protein